MEKTENYTVKITIDAEHFYYETITYFYKYHSKQSAERKSSELLNLAISLSKDPLKGSIEDHLTELGLNHRFILYYYTPRKAISFIYFIDEANGIVYVTDFFPCQMNDKNINKRSNQ